LGQTFSDSVFAKEEVVTNNILELPISNKIQTNSVQIGWDSILTPFNATFITKEKSKASQKIIPYPGIKKQVVSKDFAFYFILTLFLFLGILNAVFKNYFNIMIRVFFKTSLRQSQLTDQLMQAKLPSLFLNIFSVLVTGFYIFTLLNYKKIISFNQLNVLFFSCLAVLLIYIGKYFIVQIAGWISGFKNEAVSYTFLIFLVNKLLAIVLLPATCILVFSGRNIGIFAYNISLLAVGVFYLLRCFRSYGIFENKLSMGKFHFLLYVLAVEFIPVLLVLKIGLNIIDKNL
jgi:hypothetical protein